MSIKKSATTRIYSYFFGALIQIATILILTSNLEIYQFGVWGITVSFVFLISSISQLTYSQNIEKYFPNLSSKERKIFLIKYFKTIIFTFPIVLFILYLLKQFNYFTKFNIENLRYLLIMIALWSILESLLSIFDTYFLSKKNNIKYDLSDLYVYKLPRLLIFYFLLINSYSVFYLIGISILLRGLLFLFLIHKEFRINRFLLQDVSKNSIFKNNFVNFKYNIFAFANNTIYISFVNIVFLIVSVFSKTIDIAHYSLLIVIINNLRPVMNSIPSILTPIISNILKLKEDFGDEVKKVNFYNQLFISSTLVLSLLVIEYRFFINIFLPGYFDGIYKLIYLSIFASTLRSQYFTSYVKLLFNKKEKMLLLFNITNIFFVSSAYILVTTYYPLNFIYIYILYEINFLLFTRFFTLGTSSFTNIFKSVLWSNFFTIFISFLYFINIFDIRIFLILILFLIRDFKVKNY